MDWATVSALATAAGTLVLAIATFASVRSANRSARTAERALLFGMQPLLFPSRLQDPPQKINWIDRHWTQVTGGHAAAEVTEDVIYMAMSLRNVGSGPAVLQAWHVIADFRNRDHEPVESFRRLTRDLYIAANDTGFWQGAIRDRTDPEFSRLEGIIQEREMVSIEVLYTNAEGGQRMISRFNIVPAGDDGWLCTVARHFSLDGPSPR